ncbi:MAG: tetratricopeptide repeat protein [Thiobacillus sp.]
MAFTRLGFGCFSFLLAANFAQASQYCGSLPKNSAAYYSCEALNQQERFERDRKREAQEQEKKRKTDQFWRELREKRERETQEHQARTHSREELETLQMALELLPIIGGLETAKNALEASKCSEAQRGLDDVQPKIKQAKASYSKDGNVLAREDLENLFVALQSQVYITCLAGPQRAVKLKAYLEQEAGNGNKLAQELFAKAKDMAPEEFEVQANKSAGGKSKTVPKFSDYGTDMASVSKYLADLSETSIDACRAGWAQKDADAAYCLALKEKGEANIAMLREASKLGHPIAQNNLATELDNGNRPEDSAEINKLIKASARSGVPHAQVTVGWWHMTGEHGFQVNHAEAMKWSLKAYKQGHSEGANNIGELYEKGHGVPKDIEKAKSWYKKSSVLGNAEAAERLERLSRKN